MDHLKRFESGEPPDDPQGARADSDGKKFVVNEVLITDVSVVADVLPVGGKFSRLTFDLPEVKFRYDSEQGLPMGQLAATLLKAILKAVVDKAGGTLPEDLIDDLGLKLAGLRDVGKIGVEVIGDLTERAETLRTDLKKAGEDVTRLGEDVGKVFEGVGGLLKKQQTSQD